MRTQKPRPTRRALLSAIGTGVTAGLIGTDAGATGRGESQYTLVQGDKCVPIRPLHLQLSVDTFYDYQLPRKYVSDANGASVGETARFASAGTMDLQRNQTSIIFLYRGPEGLSLVIVHGSVQNSDAGAVTFRISGLPEDGRWVVKDDLYRDPDSGEPASANYDRWDVDSSEHRIDWTWGSAGTDGGAFRGLGDDFEIVVTPAFNEDAALYNEHYEGTVTDWEFLSGTTAASERISLSMNEPIRIMTGSCAQDDEDESDGETGERRERYTVCHKPPGNPDNAKTIHVGSESALEAHLSHGDTEGPCSEED